MTSKVEPYFDEIIALVADGVPVAAALRQRPEYPALATWKLYAFDKRFPDRRRRLENAQVQGSSDGRSARYADEIIALVESGKTIGDALASNPNYPARSKFRLYVLKHPAIERRLDDAKRKRSIAAPVFDTVVADVSLGKSVAKALAALPQQVSKTAMQRLLHNDPERAKALRLARYSASRIVRRRQEARTRPVVDHLHRQALLANDLYQRVSRAMPKRYDSDRYDDVLSDCMVALLSGEITEDDIGQTAKHRDAHYWANEDRFRNSSLDQKVGSGAGEMLLIDVISGDDVAHWGC